MTFLNAILSFGAAAFTIPLIIHLLNRSKYLTVDWGAMQFLQSSLQVNSRRVQWKQLLLLLLRCLIPVLLALAMARPLLQAWKSSNAQDPMAVAIVLDDSLSMQRLVGNAGDAGAMASSQRRVDLGLEALRGVLEKLPRQSEVSVILAGDPFEQLEEHQPEALLRNWDATRKRITGAGKLDVAGAMRAGVEWLSRANPTRRQMLLISDFASADWQQRQLDAVQEVQRLLDKPSVPIEWSWMRVGGQVSDGPASDVSVVSMECMPSLLAPNTQSQLSATLVNHGEEAAQVPVVLLQGLEEIERQSVSIGPKSTTIVRFPWRPQRAEDAELTIRIELEDRSPADNTMLGVVRVREPKKVLLIDGDRKAEPMKSESDFVRLALTPFSLLLGEPGDLVTTRVVDANGWNEAQLRDVDGVVCCNVAQLNPNERQWLRAFVERGGGLIVCVGDRVQIDTWNAWEATQQGGLRPGVLRGRADWSGKVETTATPLLELSKATRDSLGTAQFEHRLEFEVDDPTASVGMAFSDGKPFLVSLGIGRGRCIWMMSSCDEADSNLPSRPAFVPLIQRLLAFAMQMQGGWRAGQPGEVWQESWARNPGAPSQTISVQFPDGSLKEYTLPAAGNDTERSEYPTEIRLSRGLGIARANTGAEERKMVIASSDSDRRQECDPEVIGADAWQTMVATAQAKPVSNATDWFSAVAGLAGGRELWTWCWGALLACFLAEIALQQSMSARPNRPGSASRTSEALQAGKRGAA
ncbi:MAG: BatA domain-containing protein [Pirellula sp.]